MKQSDRNIIFDKYNGKCAYCGCELVKGWQMAKSQVNAMGGETVSKWNNAIEKLYNVADAIRSNYQITNYDFLECIDNGWCYEQVCFAEMFKFSTNVIGKLAYSTC